MIALALVAAAFMNGDWLAVIAHTQNSHGTERQLRCTSVIEEFKTQCFWAMAVGYGIYFGFCGYLEWKYYTMGRGRESEWKCQPDRHLPRHLVLDQIKWGCIGLMVTNAVSAVVATHISCGGYSRPVFIVVVDNPVASYIRPAVPFYGLALYTYYHGIVQHSGIVFKARWWQPWQPDCMFHDNHHQYCHVNYGFNCFMWDKIHGSMRKIDRCYSEDTDSWGSGRLLTNLSNKEWHHESRERIAENPKAYRENVNPYSLQDHISSEKIANE